ncbi:MAG: ribosomal L7Ae/L30e/S12e/Gadd45 family protein [Firmicutes bacterium]|nr:ribosomal L7Ae/L30e/S12e/Gadd45 family protein [Bacillota bacterium]
MADEKKVLGLLGLCGKAGRVASGEFQCEEAIRSRHAHLVLLASDVSVNTGKKFTDKCHFYRIPCFRLSCSKAELGHCIGREERACAAVTDPGLAASMRKYLEESSSSEQIRKVEEHD